MSTTAGSGCKFGIQRDCVGLGELLDGGLLSDIAVVLPGGQRFAAHRVVLAACSDTLRAKFLSPCRDAAEGLWEPGCGSPGAWSWVMNWMYGRAEELPAALLIEAYLLADCFQMRGLLAGIEALPQDQFAEDPSLAEEVACEAVQAWAWPEFVAQLAEKCFATVPPERSLWGRLRLASPQVAAAMLRCYPVASESHRLQLLRAWLRAQGGGDAIPTAFLSVVRWSCLPAEVLHHLHSGDVARLEEQLRVRPQSPEPWRECLFQAATERCRRLERRESLGRSGLLLPSGADRLPPPQGELRPGLFAAMGQEQPLVDVLLSSVHDCTPASRHALFKLNTVHFGTQNQSPAGQGPEGEPWIEVQTAAFEIRPEAVGLKHGWTVATSVCQDYVVEAAGRDGSWAPLLAGAGPLAEAGAVFPVQLPEGAGGFFTRFRIRMTGPDAKGDWYLMVGWFDVFGQFRRVEAEPGPLA